MASMTVGMVTFDTTDVAGLAAWWARNTGGTVHDDPEGRFATVALDGLTLGFGRVADPTPGKNRLHLDVTVDDRAATVAALLADGATHVAEHDMDAFRWTVLADPDGNQFCVAQRDGA